MNQFDTVNYSMSKIAMLKQGLTQSGTTAAVGSVALSEEQQRLLVKAKLIVR